MRVFFTFVGIYRLVVPLRRHFAPRLLNRELPQAHVPLSPFVHVKTVSAPRDFGKDNLSYLSIAGVHARQLFV
jgi:hypothetical protein